jgi:hypothetical protein
MSLREAETSRRHTSKSGKPGETKAQTEKRLAKGEAQRLALRAQLATDEDAVLTFREWCTLNGFGERTGRRILAAPGGPIVTKLTEKRIGITRRHNREWLERRALPR